WRTTAERRGGLLDNLHALSRDRIPVPIEEHEEHLARHHWRRCGWRGRGDDRQRGAEPHGEARHHAMRRIFGTDADPGYDRAESRICRCQIPVIEVEGQRWVDVVAHPCHRLVAELPLAVVDEGA